MSNMRVFTSVWFVFAAVLLAGSLRAQTEDVFAFIPAGGKTLFSEAVQGAPAGDVQALLRGERTGEEWLRYLEEHKATLPGLSLFGEYELLTLADYLAFNAPLEERGIPSDPGSADWDKLLPPDGRDFALENCQFCHIITVVVTQDRTREAWLNSLNKPSHVEIELTPEQREALVRYLVVNAGIPEDLVPEELRAGGATY